MRERALNSMIDYWKVSGGISINKAKEFALREGFGFEVGRQSRFENARNAVVIGKRDLKNGLVNRIELAEEIQHGLDRPTREASKAIRRGLTNEQFHAELFARILDHQTKGHFQFLTTGDLEALRQIIEVLK